MPLDTRRVRPEEDTNEAAVEQVRDMLVRLPHQSVSPLFRFDAGYDSVKLRRGLEGHRAHVLVRLYWNHTFYAAPEELEPRLPPCNRPPGGRHVLLVAGSYIYRGIMKRSNKRDLKGQGADSVT